MICFEMVFFLFSFSICFSFFESCNRESCNPSSKRAINWKTSDCSLGICHENNFFSNLLGEECCFRFFFFLSFFVSENVMEHLSSLRLFIQSFVHWEKALAQRYFLTLHYFIENLRTELYYIKSVIAIRWNANAIYTFPSLSLSVNINI